jgi:predicted metal-binding membrane protein
MMSEPVSRPMFFSVLALLFAVSATLTIMSGASMSGMNGMAMPGGWTMTMTWMPGQSWPDAMASFLSMWATMMVAMMLPSLGPMLWRYHQVAGPSAMTLIGMGYFFVWMLLGVFAFALGITLAAVLMHQPALAHAVPVVAGIVVLLASTLQFTRWKAHQLACCRVSAECCHRLPVNAVAACRQGLRLGLHCCACCSGLTAVLLVIGMMDLRAMAAVTAAITAERLAPAGKRVAGAIGIVGVGAGVVLIARAVWAA